MELTKEENVEKHCKQKMHCLRNTLSTHEWEGCPCSCGYNVMKQKRELTKTKRKN